MSTIGTLSRHLHFSEFNVSLSTGAGILSPAQRKATARENLGFGAQEVVVGGGAVVLPDGGGKVLIPLVTANVTVTLPAPIEGVEYSFIFIGSAADAEDWVISTPAGVLFIGGLAHFDVGGTNAAVYANGSTHNTLTVNNPAAGCRVDVIGTGTAWAVTGMASSADAPAFSAV